jgi:hypothetical protein
MKALCTFSGKFGDILWSLATAKEIAQTIVHGSIDFAVMPYYTSLLPLLASQDFIANAFVLEDWMRTHSNHGDQPWQPPTIPEGYDQVWHLTYKGHPGISAPEMPLIDFIAWQQGIRFRENPIPYLNASEEIAEVARVVHFASGQLPEVVKENRLVSYAFNDQYQGEKKTFFETLWRVANPAGLEFINVGEMGWKEAAWVIKNSLAYVGCRSACWVVAMGLGQSTITYEPHPSRHRDCHLGKVFGSQYGREFTTPYMLPPEQSGQVAATVLKDMMDKEMVQKFLTREKEGEM